MKKFIVCLLASFSISATAADVVLCNGGYWDYRYEFGVFRCDVINTLREDIPNSLKRGHISKAQISNEEGWKSIAKLQMDGAKCCIVTSTGSETMRCK